MAEELFDVCDADDQVIGQERRSVVHREGLLHRAVHIWVFRPAGSLVVHLRSTTKDEYPSCYTSSASGHLGVGESYESAAHRELLEELGISGDLVYVTKLPAGPETAREHTVLYMLETDQSLTPDPNEIAALEEFTWDELATRVREAPERFTPPFRSLVTWWLQNRRT